MILDRPSSVDDAIGSLLGDPAIARLVAAHRVIEPRPPRHAPWPEGLDPRLVSALRGRGVEALYTHQAEAIEAVRAGRNVCVVTPTASGKTLCYNLPVLDAMARDAAARALYLFPTKALAADQLVELRALAEAAELDLKTHTYDGDTPPTVRTRGAGGRARSSSPTRTCSTPRILPHHTKWFKLFENLQYVVIDELHTYRGLFGSHVANVIRRLRRICAPLRLATRSSSAPAPPSPTPATWPSGSSRRRSSSSTTTARRRGAGTSWSSEPAGRQRAARHPRLGAAHRAARRGAPHRRRRADDRLRPVAHLGRGADHLPARDLRAAARPPAHHPRLPRRLPAERAARDRARPARRPGPGRGRHQRARAGDRHRRPGRRHQRRLPGHHRLDLAADGPRRPAGGHQPRRRWSAHRRPSTSSWPPTPTTSSTRSPEHGLVNPDNLHVLLNHLRASSFELPVPAAERFGIDETPALLDVLEEDGYLRQAEDDRYHWSHENFPASSFSLRSGAPGERRHRRHHRRPRTGSSARWTSSRLRSSSTRRRSTSTRACSTTSIGSTGTSARPTSRAPTSTTTPMPTSASRSRCSRSSRRPMQPPAGMRQRGEVMVAWKVTMFKKIKYHTHENVGWGSISHPRAGDAHHRHAGSCRRQRLVNRYDRDTLDGALIGLARVARTTGSLLLMCDPRDLGVLAQVQAPFTGRADPVPVRRGARRRGPDRAALSRSPDELIRACREAVDVVPLHRWLPGVRRPGDRGREAGQGGRHPSCWPPSMR